jgi:mono/diheme cytochrome c family protein
VTGDKARLVQIILGGWQEPLEVDGFVYAERVMPKHGFLTDQEIADVATYIRQSFGNNADPVTMAEVREGRDRLR